MKIFFCVLVLLGVAFLFLSGLGNKEAREAPVRVSYESNFEGGNVISVTFVDLKTGEKIRYVPKKDTIDAASMGSLFYQPVLSADADWICLPQGRVDGFVYFPMREWRAGVDGKTGMTFHVRAPNGPALEHDFVEWVDDHTVRFSIKVNGLDNFVDVDLAANTAKVSKGELPAEWMHFEGVRGG